VFRAIDFVGALFGDALEAAQAGPLEAPTEAGATSESRAALYTTRC